MEGLVSFPGQYLTLFSSNLFKYIESWSLGQSTKVFTMYAVATLLLRKSASRSSPRIVISVITILLHSGVGVGVNVKVGVAVADGVKVKLGVKVSVGVAVGPDMVAGRPTTLAVRYRSTIPSRLAVKCRFGHTVLIKGEMTG